MTETQQTRTFERKDSRFAGDYDRPDPQTDRLRRVPPGAHQVIAVLTKDATKVAPGESRDWMVHPFQRFVPTGLIFWDVPKETTIERVQVGNTEQSPSDWGQGGVPAHLFDGGKTFAEIERLAEMGELGMALPERMIWKLDTVEPGCILRVRARGPFGGACAWGIVPDGSKYGALDARVRWQEESKDYRAEVMTLDAFGPILRFGATTVSEAGAIELVKAYLGRPYG